MTETPLSDHKIDAASVTKPIQLLAAWLVGLLALNVSFLTAAAAIHQPTWAAGFLVVCAAVNVPLFLVCLFVLQTKFRPEMQEDQFYSQYLERRVETGKVEIVAMSDDSEIPPPTRVATTDFTVSRNRTAKLLQALDIQVNDLLPDFKEISDRLSAAGIHIKRTFGSTSEDPEAPPFTLLSFSPAVTVDQLQNILRLLDGKIDKIGIASEIYARGAEIYVGSYAYRAGWKSLDYNATSKRNLLREGMSHQELMDIFE